ncbi:MAG: hypothetical protein PQJ60_13530 [Spirochaetales bacterium]|nr:hypothetical protein [Spirochaetales bacterium]
MNDKHENIRTSLEGLEKDVLLDGLSLLYEEFKEDARAVQDAVPTAVSAEPEIPNFVSLILYLKSKYKFDELNDITVEGGRVFFKRGGRRIELSREEAETVAPPPVPESKDKEDMGGRFGRLELN